MMIRMLKELKEQKKCVTKRILKFDNFIDCLFKNEIILKSQQTFKSEAHCAYTEEVNKIALSGNDDKRLQTFLTELEHIHMEQMLLNWDLEWDAK